MLIGAINKIVGGLAGAGASQGVANSPSPQQPAQNPAAANSVPEDEGNGFVIDVSQRALEAAEAEAAQNTPVPPPLVELIEAAQADMAQAVETAAETTETGVAQVVETVAEAAETGVAQVAETVAEIGQAGAQAAEAVAGLAPPLAAVLPGAGLANPVAADAGRAAAGTAPVAGAAERPVATAAVAEADAETDEARARAAALQTQAAERMKSIAELLAAPVESRVLVVTAGETAPATANQNQPPAVSVRERA